jgi:hypothetical protein
MARIIQCRWISMRPFLLAGFLQEAPRVPSSTHGQRLAEECVGLNTFAGRALAPRGLITPEGPTSKLSGWIKRDYVGET